MILSLHSKLSQEHNASLSTFSTPFIHAPHIYSLILNWKRAYSYFSVFSPSFLTPLFWGGNRRVHNTFAILVPWAGSGHQWGAAGIQAASQLTTSPVPHLGQRLGRCRRRSSIRAFSPVPMGVGKVQNK